MKKKLLSTITALLMAGICLCAPALPVYADDPPETATAAQDETAAPEEALIGGPLLPVYTGYRFDDGSADIWMTGTAINLGQGQALAPFTLVTFDSASDPAFAVVSAEKEELYSRLGIDITDYDETIAHLETYLGMPDGSFVVGTPSRYNADRNLALLTFSGYDGQIESISFAENSTPEDMVLTAFPAASLAAAQNGFTDPQPASGAPAAASVPAATADAADVIRAEGQFDAGFMGALGTDAGNTPVGMVTELYSDHAVLTRSSDILAFLAGETGIAAVIPEPIPEDAAEETATETQASERMEQIERLGIAIDRANALDLSGYTEESANVLRTAVSHAEAVLSNVNATTDEITQAGEAINAAKAALEEQQPESGTINMGRLAVLVVIIAACVAAYLFISRKVIGQTRNASSEEKPVVKKTVKPKREKKKTAEPSRDEAYGGEYARTSKELPPSHDEDDREAGTSVLSSEEEATTLLNEHAMINAYLLTEMGEKVPITKREFSIGKESKKVSYCIKGNPTISRKHCMIKIDGSDFSLIDLASLNGTFLNGVQLEANRPTRLSDGDRITLSDTDLTFRMED